MHRSIRRAVAFVLVLAAALVGQDPPPKKLGLPPGLGLGQPLVLLAGGIATLQVPPGMKYLDIAATARIREGIWGNAPDATVQGMLVKDGFDQQAEGRFGVTVHWQPIGYVDAAEWQNLDAEALLSAWRRQVEASNAERRARGDAPVEILGMAAPPRSDAAKGTATWAKRYRVGPDELIAYESRAFGRNGVFVFKATGTKDQLAELAAASELVVSRLSFQAGQRYADVAPSDPRGRLEIATEIAKGVWEQLPTFQRILLIVLALSALFGLVRLIARVFGR